MLEKKMLILQIQIILLHERRKSRNWHLVFFYPFSNFACPSSSVEDHSFSRLYVFESDQMMNNRGYYTFTENNYRSFQMSTKDLQANFAKIFQKFSIKMNKSRTILIPFL